MTFSLLISPHLSIPVFSQNDGSSCGKEIILPPAAELCNNNDYKMEKEAMWFEFTANATSHELIVSYSETPPLAEITKLQLFENKCHELHLRKEVTVQPPELPRMLADQLIVGEKYKVRAERVPGFETGNFKMCITRDEVGGGGGPSDKHISGHCAPATTPWENPTATTFLSLCSDYTQVGIGTDDPHHSLDVHGHIGLENHLIFNSTSTHGVINWPQNGSLYFRTNPTAGDISNSPTHMIITGNGNIGLSNTPSNYRLSIGNGLNGSGGVVNQLHDKSTIGIPIGDEAAGGVKLYDAQDEANQYAEIKYESGFQKLTLLNKGLGFRIENTGKVTFDREIALLGRGAGGIGGELILTDYDQPLNSELKAWAIDNQDRNLRIFYNNGGTAGVFGLIIKSNGDVGIGCPNPQSKLSVNGTVTAKKFKATSQGWCDFVFKKNYKIPDLLKEVEPFIKAKGHLPGIPTEEEVKTNGLDLGDINAQLLLKMEEMTLYTIDQEKRIQNLEKEIEYMKKKLDEK